MDLITFKSLAEKTSVDYAVKLCMKLGETVPSPVGYNSVHMCDTINVYAPWDNSLNLEYRTMLSKTKVHMIKQLLGIAPNKTAIELGVYQGGITRMMLEEGFDVYACDTFNGIAGSGKNDLHKNGEFSSGDISDYINGAKIIKGELPASLEGFRAEIGFAHFDLDVYEPTKDCIEIIWPMMVDGGIMVFDDYGGWTTSGVMMAVNEREFEKSIYLPTGQLVVFK